MKIKYFFFFKNRRDVIDYRRIICRENSEYHIIIYECRIRVHGVIISFIFIF